MWQRLSLIYAVTLRNRQGLDLTGNSEGEINFCGFNVAALEDPSIRVTISFELEQPATTMKITASKTIGMIFFFMIKL